MKPLIRNGILCVGILIAVGVGSMAGMVAWIDHDVQKTTQWARETYPQDAPIEALIQAAQDTNQSLQTRNRAVWALGRLSDPRALTFLESVYTGDPCDHAHHLCQVELEKAIRRCKEGSELKNT